MLLTCVVNIVDRGACNYPSLDFIARLHSIYKFVEKVVPRISHCKNIKKDITNYLAPLLTNCRELFCNRHILDRRHHVKPIVHCILTKFVKPNLTNYSNHINRMSRTRPIVENKPRNRKILKFA